MALNAKCASCGHVESDHLSIGECVGEKGCACFLFAPPTTSTETHTPRDHHRASPTDGE